MITLHTERLGIRNFSAGDWRDLHEIAVQYQASEYAQYDHRWPTAESEVKGMAEWFSRGDGFLAACLKQTGKLIGLLVLNRELEREGVVYNLGYVFNFDYHGQGYATEGCMALLDRAFGPLAADRVVTGTAAANEPSCRLLRRLGLRQTSQGTGSFRETEDGEAIEFESGEWAISREEWLERRQASVLRSG